MPPWKERLGDPQRLIFPSIALLVVLWAATALPLIASGPNWGIWDWDHHFASAEIERQAVAEHHTLPLWNPYVAGGVPVLQHPLSLVFCPDFVFLLLFGVPVGLKLLIAFRLALGLAGGYALGRALELSPPSAALFAALANASGAYTAHVVAGHAEWSLLGYAPWVVLALLHCTRGAGATWVAVAALGTALLYLGGGIYLLFGLGFFWLPILLFDLGRERSLRVLVRGLLPFLIAAGLCGVKLLPSYELFSAYPRETPPEKALFAPWPARPWLELPRAAQFSLVDRGFVWPEQDVLRHKPLKDYTPQDKMHRARFYDWINFSAYFGALPLLLVALGLRSRNRYLAGLVASSAFLLTLGLSSSMRRSFGFDPWELLRQLPILGTLRTSGRFYVMATFGLAAIAALGLETLVVRPPRWLRLPSGAVALGVLVLVVADHGQRNAGLLQRAFPYQPLEVTRSTEFKTLAVPRNGFDYASVLAREGAWAAHSNLTLPKGAVSDRHESYAGEAQLVGGNGSARIVSIRPNEIEVEVEASATDTLVINQTFVEGWRRRDGETGLFSRGRRIATEITPQDRLVRLHYRPRLLSTGIGLSLLSLAGLIAFVVRARPSARRMP